MIEVGATSPWDKDSSEPEFPSGGSDLGSEVKQVNDYLYREKKSNSNCWCPAPSSSGVKVRAV